LTHDTDLHRREFEPGVQPVKPVTSPNEPILVLTDLEHRAVKELIESLPVLSHPDEITDELLNQVELCQKSMPSRLAHALISFKRTPHRTGNLIIRNLPTDPVLPPTPSDAKPSRTKTSSFSEYSLLLSMLFLGEPISFLDEKDGVLIQNICPVKGQEKKQENVGSCYLEFHTEDGFHPYKPDYLGLICLRPDHDGIAKTTAASVRNVVQWLPVRAMELLRQPLFRLRLSTSFGSNGEPVYSKPGSILSGHWLEPDLCIDYFLMEALTPEARWAFELLKELLLKVVVEHALRPGDLMIVDNRMAAHGRTSFTPCYDGADRWLQRMFVLQDFRRTAASRGTGGHKCAPLSVEWAMSS
jgi:L-asparagine oxygenase